MLIGLGGGAASSVASGQSSEDLDFASVQRDNPEMERRCQEVIDRCVALGELQPDPFHARRRCRRPVERDPGTAARLRRRWRRSTSPRCPATIRRCRRCSCGATNRRNATCSASPPSTWPSSKPCAGANVARTRSSARPRRKNACWSVMARCPAPAVISPSTCRWTCCSARRRRCIATPIARAAVRWPKLDTGKLDLREAGLRVLAHPTVAAKNFLVTIGDRTVGGLCSRDQMVGPWQLPLADCAITLTDFLGLRRRSDGDRRTHAAGPDRCRGLGAHGRRRGDHQSRRGAGRFAWRT